MLRRRIYDSTADVIGRSGRAL